MRTFCYIIYVLLYYIILVVVKLTVQKNVRFGQRSLDKGTCGTAGIPGQGHKIGKICSQSPDRGTKSKINISGTKSRALAKL